MMERRIKGAERKVKTWCCVEVEIREGNKKSKGSSSLILKPGGE
jgi:hypothetical protein